MATSSETSDQTNVKSKRPAESAFKQQRLPAWQPILTAGTVLPTFFVIGIAFIPVGIGLLYFSDEVKEHVIDYTECTKVGDTITCADYIKQNDMSKSPKCICEMELNLTEDFKSEVFFYYGLSNYYQNHRRYVKSRDDNQLLGRLNPQPSSDCEPFAYDLDENGVKKPVAPCGAIANSLFNDTLTLHSQEQQVTVPVLRTGIAWTSDKEIKFRNPTGSSSLKDAFANFTKPANWAKNVWELDPENDDNNGFQNEDLIVWMRTAALPTFRKLYRRVDHTQTGFRTGLNKGPYTLRVEYNYPVTDFDGTKSFVISTTSLLGGKNPFLGVAYVVVGTLCLLLGIVLLIIHVRCSKRFPRLIQSESALLSRAAPGPAEPGAQPGPHPHDSQQHSTSKLKERTKKFLNKTRLQSKKPVVTTVEAPPVSAAQQILQAQKLQTQILPSSDKTTKENTALKPLTLDSEQTKDELEPRIGSTKQMKDELEAPDVEMDKQPGSSVTPPNPFEIISETKNTSGSVELKPVSSPKPDAGEPAYRTLENHSDESVVIKVPSTEASTRGASSHSATKTVLRQNFQQSVRIPLDNDASLKPAEQEIKPQSELDGIDSMMNGENRSRNPPEDTANRDASTETLKQQDGGSQSSSRTPLPAIQSSETISDGRKKREKQ